MSKPWGGQWERNYLHNPPVECRHGTPQEALIQFIFLYSKLVSPILYADFPYDKLHMFVKKMKRIKHAPK